MRANPLHSLRSFTPIIINNCSFFFIFRFTRPCVVVLRMRGHGGQVALLGEKLNLYVADIVATRETRVVREVIERSVRGTSYIRKKVHTAVGILL